MKKGFTLVEMIAVIVILAAIALIVVPEMISIINNQKDKLYKEQIVKINEAADLYATKEANTSDDFTVPLSTLKTRGYLDNKDIIDPRDNSVIDGTIHFVWNATNNRYDYTFTRDE